MNIRYVIRELGLVMIVLCLCMIAVMGWSAWEWAGGNSEEKVATLSMLMGAALGAVLGLFCWLFGSRSGKDYLGQREALLLVTTSWFLAAAVACLPYYLWAWLEEGAGASHPFASFISCYFESVSGLTTTGATILSDVDMIPKSLLLWRATTHWLGGLGIVVLFVAILPTLGVSGKRLFQAEVPGPQQDGVRPRIRETARILWLIYLGLTIVQVLMLKVAGMNWFDSICHTFATLATGGFGTHNASVGYYDNWKIEMIIFVFMVIAGINFGLYYNLVRGRWRMAVRDPQMIVYLCMLGVSIAVIAGYLYGHTITLTTGQEREVGVLGALRYSSFQVGSIHSDCGFATADYDQWSYLPKTILMLGMFFGGCAGSTSGGLKISRLIVLFKLIAADIERAFRPSVVRTVRVGDDVVDQAERQSVLMYTVLTILVLGIATIVVRVVEDSAGLSLTESGSAVLACFTNCGPGLGIVGPTGNFGVLHLFTQALLCIVMVLGRLEVYAVLVLLRPAFWLAD